MSKRIPIGILRQIIMRINAGLSDRGIARDIAEVSRPTVSVYRKLVVINNLTNEALAEMSDKELEQAFSKQKSETVTNNPSKVKQAILERLEYIQSQLKETGVTLQLLWEEFLRELDGKQACSYQTFCRTLQPHLQKTDLSYRNPKPDPGSVIMIDFAGKKLSYTDRNTGKEIPCVVFVAVLGNSKYSYVEVIPNASTVYVLQALTNTLKFFGGAPSSLLTDNMAQLVRKADRYEPAFTDAALAWANHYGIYIRATRIYSPQDKAQIERLVRLTYERIYATLRNYTAYSLEELGKSVKEKLQEHNDHKFSGKSFSRSDAFKTDEQPHLRPLPATHFELHNVTKAKVQKNYHIYLGEDRHFYSVPYQLAGEQLDVRYSAKVVQIFNKLDLVATHLRTAKAFDYTTNKDHMPEAHKAHKEVTGYTGEDFLIKAAANGTYTHLYMVHLLKSRSIKQQTYRSCQGLLSLGFSKKYGAVRLEDACELACQLGKYTYKTVQGILEKKQDIAFVAFKQSKKGNDPNGSSDHDNLRGKEAFE